MTRLNALLEGVMAQGSRSPVVRAETASGELIFEAARGQARPGDPTPMTVATPFHLASVTKTMTAALILQLVEEGRAGPAGLDATLDELGVLDPTSRGRLNRGAGFAMGGRISLRNLLTHTAGMRDAFMDGPESLGLDEPAPGSFTQSRIFSQGADRSRLWSVWDASRPDDPDAGMVNFYLGGGFGDAPVGAPGERFHYSDTGYMILGLAAEVMGADSLVRLWRSRILDGLGLKATYFAYHEDPPDLGPRREPEAEVWAGEIPLFTEGYNLSPEWAGGGLVSTVADLTAFLHALRAGRLFGRRRSLEDMMTFATPPGLGAPRIGIGLGLDRTVFEGLELIGRTGAWGGRMVFEPQTGVVFAGSPNQGAAPRTWHWDFVRLAMAEVKG